MKETNSEECISFKQKDSPLIDKAKVATRENRPAEALELYEEEIQNVIQEIQGKID